MRVDQKQVKNWSCVAEASSVKQRPLGSCIESREPDRTVLSEEFIKDLIE